MEKRKRITNLLMFLVMLSIPTSIAALVGDVLWRMISMDQNGSFVSPDWIYSITCSLPPLLAFAQALGFFKLYLYLQDAAKPAKSAGLDFLLGFLPVWSMAFAWTMFWGTISNLDRLPSHNAEELFGKIMQAYADGLPLLLYAFDAAACIGIFVAFLLHAFRSVFAAVKLSRNNVETGNSCVAPSH